MSATVDIVIPVYNVERALPGCISVLHRFLSEHFPFDWTITIVDNASTDATTAVTAELARQWSGIRTIYLDRKGKGHAIRAAWSSGQADVVAYMDVVVWLSASLVVGMVGLAISVWSSRRGLEPAGIIACAVTGLLVSPITWTAHWVWLIPGITLWLWWARRRRSTPDTAGAVALLLVLVAAGALSLVAMVANLVLPSAGLTLLNNLPVLTGLATLATLGVLLSRMDRARR